MHPDDSIVKDEEVLLPSSSMEDKFLDVKLEEDTNEVRIETTQVPLLAPTPLPKKQVEKFTFH